VGDSVDPGVGFLAGNSGVANLHEAAMGVEDGDNWHLSAPGGRLPVDKQVNWLGPYPEGHWPNASHLCICQIHPTAVSGPPMLHLPLVYWSKSSAGNVPPSLLHCKRLQKSG
jgi:hypothetical protein